MKITSLCLIMILLIGAGPAMAIEEPEYEVLSEADTYEIRRYTPYIVAEVDVDGDADSAGSKAFRILAGYIFGDNEDESRMKMTAPVASQPAGGDANRHTYAFVMERKYTMDSLPRPNDPRIRLSEVDSRTMAAVQYSGRWTEKNYRQHLAELRQALAADGVATRGEPMLARYNSPFTPWFLRRNEVLLELDD